MGYVKAVVVAFLLAAGLIFVIYQRQQVDESNSARVLKAIDGDTVRVVLDGRQETVRYIGVDTPETVKPGAPVQCFGKEASLYNRRLVEGREVKLEYDREQRDRYGRLLAYTYLDDGPSVSERLLRAGMGRQLTIEPNSRYANRLVEAEAQARQSNRGLWASCR